MTNAFTSVVVVVADAARSLLARSIFGVGETVIDWEAIEDGRIVRAVDEMRVVTERDTEGLVTPVAVRPMEGNERVVAVDSVTVQSDFVIRKAEHTTC